MLLDFLYSGNSDLLVIFMNMEEDVKFARFSEYAIRKVGGIKHVMMSEINSGMLLGLKSRYVEKDINFNKISNLMSHFFMMTDLELNKNSDLKISINEMSDCKIFSTKSNDRVISLITNNDINVGLVRMLMQQAYKPT
jgi:predicted regulator of Ras-like GTPase activity (Roadblock/LC7/MglB family)